VSTPAFSFFESARGYVLRTVARVNTIFYSGLLKPCKIAPPLPFWSARFFLIPQRQVNAPTYATLAAPQSQRVTLAFRHPFFSARLALLPGRSRPALPIVCRFLTLLLCDPGARKCGPATPDVLLESRLSCASLPPSSFYRVDSAPFSQPSYSPTDRK